LAQPFFSAVIDTYNHERFIGDAIVSVLEQDFPEDSREVLVVDDGSTDRTSEIIPRFEPRVRVVRKANGGQASAFNAGIPGCRGEIIAFLLDEFGGLGYARESCNGHHLLALPK
jgi:glycosyltransferase involved in cell wall biosynthesis